MLLNKKLGLLLIILGIATHFLFLNYPAEVVFDEVHFGKFVSSYFTKEYYFDIHPPLGKLLIAGYAKLAGYQPGFDFEHIGENFDVKNLSILRFLPALFGALLPLIVYLILLRLNVSKKYAFLGGLLTLFETALLGQSKFILVDSFLLFFGFFSIYLYLRGNFPLSVLFGAMAFSIKWTGLSFLGIIFLLLCYEFFKKRNISIEKLALFILIPFFTYYAVFMVHLNLLTKPGNGNAYMSSEFQQSIGNNNMSDWQKFTELNEKMYFYNSTLSATHPYSSTWKEWPFGQKPIWYWSKNFDGRAANIYLIGNPIVFLLALIGVIFSIYLFIFKKYREKLPPLTIFFLIGYFANILPYITVTRVTFLYHYLPSLVFGIILFCIIADKINYPFKKEVYVGIVFLAITIFFILSPLVYGFSVKPALNDIYHKNLRII